MTRLIDADKLENRKFAGRVQGETEKNIYGAGWNDAIDAIMDNEPTVEERPKGKWIDNGSSGYYGIRDWYCSSCKFRWITCKKESLDPDWRFCPYCGADMREDADNV